MKTNTNPTENSEKAKSNPVVDTATGKDPITGKFVKGNKARKTGQTKCITSRNVAIGHAKRYTLDAINKMVELMEQPPFINDKGRMEYAPEVLPAAKEVYYIGNGKPGIRKHEEEQNLEITVDREEVLAKLKTLLDR